LRTPKESHALNTASLKDRRVRLNQVFRKKGAIKPNST
jgi:hypothetical protein